MKAPKPSYPPKETQLTSALVKAHEKPKNYVPFKKRRLEPVRGRVTPPVAKTKRKIGMPKLKFLEGKE